MEYFNIGGLRVSRFIIGGNPFSGFSHQSPERDLEMKRHYTTEQIKATLRQAERLGINTHVGRADHHIMRVLLEYWDEGGTIQWFAQTCPELGTIEQGIKNAIAGGAKACYVHGGVMDFLLAQGQLGEVPPAIDRIREAGMVAGIAGHDPRVFEWAEKNLDVDFYMCSYYNPSARDQDAEHAPGAHECYRDEDRRIMTELIRTLSKPAIHYKVLAAGRTEPKAAFTFVAEHLRLCDAVAVGVFTKDNPSMLEEDVQLLFQSLRCIAHRKRGELTTDVAAAQS
jgi:hypothetical protein